MSINYYVYILHRIAVLIMNNVLGVYQSSESGDKPNWVEVQIELANWLRAKSRADAIRLIPIYTVRKIVGTKARL